ncbi:MAG: hypothetical protein QHJ73_17115, partial [Armatimonadota bacterium]|nr:hypothetical protein [Armatimonadota bacterium]
MKHVRRWSGFTAVLAALLTLHGTAGRAEPFKLLDKTPVKLALLHEIASGRNKVGESVAFQVVEEIKAPNGQVLIAKGARGSGKITASSPAGMLGRAGKLEFTVEHVLAVNNARVPLRASMEQRGKGSQTAVIAASLFLSVGAVFFRGKNIVLKEGQEFTAYVDGDVIIDPAKPGVAEHASPAVAAGVPLVAPAADQGKAQFAIDPQGLDELASGLKAAIDKKPEWKERIGNERIGVFDFEVIDIADPSMGKTVVEDLSTAMINEGFNLVERAQLDKALKEL